MLLLVAFGMIVVGVGWWRWGSLRATQDREREKLRTIGGAINEVARVQGFGSLAGSAPDFGPPPVDHTIDYGDDHVMRITADPGAGLTRSHLTPGEESDATGDSGGADGSD